VNVVIGWLLAAVAVAIGYLQWAWPGVALAVTLIVFWLLLQFNRLVRVMRSAAESPLGHVDNAVMLHARLHVGLPMAKVVALTKSLGCTGEDADEVYTWTDAGGASVRVTFVDGRCASWTLTRPPA